jgi:callose synthase
LPTFVRFLQGVLAIGIIAGIALLIVLTSFTVADLFASALAFIATGWCVLCVSTTSLFCLRNTCVISICYLIEANLEYYKCQVNGW